ncbi:MAG: asparagine synthase (glutamine-hydrolyzing) [Crocinitomicaceae bacterium]|nr:asparagine synthase (glutamine-hydrolyzing) [Crocinitomicaceae bacterium]|tara:strand:- start:4052 stop:5923 length:1872 start_codon:yes stop_codon:yes gene_type:complete
MCGINGIYNHLNLNDPSRQVLNMNSLSSHRGPDHTDIYIDQDVVLGHNRLSIIDLDKRSHQPFICSDKKVILSFNGEIYNFQELKSQLKHYHFITNSDTEVVVAAYKKWGIHFLTKLDGMFAMALWDIEHKKLFLARDTMGIKPLYYYQNNNSVAFSSEIRSLFECDLVPRKLNHGALHDYLNYSTVHSPHTIIDGVFMLKAGCFLQIDENNFSISSYWDIRDSFKKKLSSENIHESIKTLFLDSVRKRLISDVPFGAFLSGGVDSSAVVAAAARSSSKPVKTFCVSFDDKAYDESNYAKIVADLYQTDHYEIKLTPNEFLKDLPSALQAMDHPSGDGPNSYIVSKAAKSTGVSMVLSGLGGDELFAGYDIFTNALSLIDKKWLFSFPPGVRKFIGLLLMLVKPSISSNKIAEVITQKYLELTYFYPIYRKLFTDKDLNRLISIKVNSLSGPFKIGVNDLSYGETGYDLPFLSKVSYLEMKTYMQNTLLRDADQMSMAHSLELRVPMLDQKLVEFVYGVSDSYKLGALPKELLVNSLGDMLPKTIVNRPKMGFLLPWEGWMRKELRDFNIGALSVLKETSIFNNTEIDEIWNKFMRNDSRVSWSKVWSLVVLGNWLQENKIEI